MGGPRPRVRPDQAPVEPPGTAPPAPPGPPGVPPNRPNPVVHPLAPGVEMVIELAVTAPVVSAVPTSLAHFRTARSVEAADWRSVKAVEEVRVSTTLESFLVDGLVSLTVTV